MILLHCGHGNTSIGGVAQGIAICICMIAVACPAQDAAKVIAVGNINPDMSCGAQCISALMKLTKSGKPDLSIAEIYAFVGKDRVSPLNMMELKIALEACGFHASGFRCCAENLSRMSPNEYAILPLGIASGTVDDALHWVLATGVFKGHLMVVDTQALSTYAIAVEELERAWKGQALIVSAGEGMRPLAKAFPVKVEEGGTERVEYDGIKDFGRVRADSVRHTFSLHRESNVPYRGTIVGKSCSCVDARLDVDSQGNPSLEMTLHFTGAGQQAGDVVISVGAGKKLLRYSVRAYREGVCNVTPAVGYIVSADSVAPECPICVEYFANGSEDVSLARVISDIPGLTAGSASVVCLARGDDERVYRWTVPLRYVGSGSVQHVRRLTGKVTCVIQTGTEEHVVSSGIIIDEGREVCKVTPARAFVTLEAGNGATARLRVEFPSDVKVSDVHCKSTVELLEVTCIAVGSNTYSINIAAGTTPHARVASGLTEGKIGIAYHLEGHETVTYVPVTICSPGDTR